MIHRLWKKNRSLEPSNFRTSPFLKWVMNQYHHIDNKLQFDFLLNIVRRRKRFSKWIKADVIADLDAVKQYYGYSNEKAKVALTLLTPEAVGEIKKRISRGGK